MPTRHGGRAAKNSNTFARLTRLRITTAPSASTNDRKQINAAAFKMLA
jgi:hypothetical protein